MPPFLRSFVLALLVGLPVGLQAAPGDNDPTFVADNSTVWNPFKLALQTDGRVLFNANSTVNSVTSGPQIQRLQSNGKLDPSLDWAVLNPRPVNDILVLSDGKVLVALRSALEGSGKTVVRLLPDGSLDPTFNQNPPVVDVNLFDGQMALQSNGQLLVGRSFLATDPSDDGLTRLNPDGSPDPTFVPQVNGDVYAVAIQGDGKVIVAGDFSTVGGKSQPKLARLNIDGSLDETFRPHIKGGFVMSLTLQPDGKILAGGNMQGVGGLPLPSLLRLNPDGSPDLTFRAVITENTAGIREIAVQADGKILIVGGLVSVDGVARHGIARLLPDGKLDTSFAALPPEGSSGSVQGLVLQSDGKPVFSRNVTSGTTTLRRLQRLQSDAALQTITVTGSGAKKTVRWQRGGSAPEILGATLELSQDFGRTYSVIGQATRIAGGWELKNVTLPSSGQIRASSSTAGCHRGWGGTQGIHSVAAFGRVAVPELAVEVASGAPMADGGQLTFAPANPGTPISRSLILRNLRDADLLVQSVQISGADAGLFQITQAPASRVAGGDGRTVLEVTFTPGASLQSRLATLLITTNDPTVPTFDVHLQAEVQLSNDATLRDLRLAGTSVAGFAPDQLNYVIPPASYSGGTVSILPITAQAAATVKINAVSERTTWNLQSGLNVFAIKVRAQDGSTTKTYVLNVTRLPSIPANVSPPEITVLRNSVEITAGSLIDFGSAYAQEDNVVPLTIKNTASGRLRLSDIYFTGPDAGLFEVDDVDLGYEISTNGEKILALKLNASALGPVSATLHIESNDADEPDLEFPLTGVRQTSRNAVLQSVLLTQFGSGLPATAIPGAPVMTFAVLPTSDRITLKPVAEAQVTSVRVNGIVVSTGSSTSAITLNVGVTAIPISITALDGSIQDYELQVTRPPGGASSTWSASASGPIFAAVPLPDGKTLVAGDFLSIKNFGPSGLARLRPDGLLDSSFDLDNSWEVAALAVLPDGSCLVAGSLYSPQARTGLFRLRLDGTVDLSFDADLDGDVTCIAIQSDGKILIGGGFTTVGGLTRNGVARLQANGAVDAGFNADVTGVGVTGPLVNCVALQADGKIFLGGAFTSVGGITKNRLARVNADGTLDTTFTRTSTTPVRALHLQPDGKVVVGGRFSLTGTRYVARFFSDGTHDSSFVSSLSDDVYSIAQQADGKVIVGVLQNSVTDALLRLNTNGTVDASFDTGSPTTWQLHGVLLLDNGKVLATGAPTTSRLPLTRVDNEPATDSLTVPSAGTVRWLRGGSAPEVTSVRFEVSEDVGETYTLLGTGTAIPGGWELTGLTLPAICQIRASARVTGGRYNGSSYFTQRVAIVGQTTSPNLVVMDGSSLIVEEGEPIDLGVMHPGDTQLFNVVLHNTGTAPMTGVTGALVAPLNGYTPGAAPPTTLGVGGMAVVSVWFSAAPSDVGTTRTGTLLVTSNEGVSREVLFQVNVELSTDSALTDLQVLHSTLSPSFTPAQHDYTVSVAAGVSAIQVQATASNFGAALALTVDSGPASTPLTSRQPSAPIELEQGGDTVFDIEVTAQSGATTHYTITVHRAEEEVLGDVNPGFNAEIEGGITATATQPDGKILIAGSFYKVGGVVQSHLARLNADGTLDAAFAPVLDSAVECLAVLPDGRILIGGWFTSVNGVSRSYLARLNADGTLDTTLAVTPSAQVYCMGVTTTGSFYLGGAFTSVNGASIAYLARVSANGSLDSSFTPAVGDWVMTLAIQSNNSVVFGGRFTTVAGFTRNRIARVNVSDTLDGTFNPNANSTVSTLLLQPDGKIIVGGEFTMLNNAARGKLARLETTGATDATFAAEAQGYTIRSAVLQADGKVLIGGDFLSVNGTPWSRIARVDSAGQLDASFKPRLSGNLYSLALTAGGQVLVGGSFDGAGGHPIPNLAMLVNESSSESLTRTSQTNILWTRDGTGPEVTRAWFEVSTDNGVSWNSLGAGTRTANGWSRSGVPPPSAILRAFGAVRGGQGGSSEGIISVETSYSGFLGSQIVVQYAGANLIHGATVDAGTMRVGTAKNLTFTVKNTGTTPFYGLSVLVPPDISIVTAPVKNLQPGKSTTAVVRVVATSGVDISRLFQFQSGDVFSPFDVTIKAVVPDPPAISGLWGGYAMVVAGLRQDFKVPGIIGTGPFTYQWKKNGAALAAQKTDTLRLDPAKLADAGDYTLTITDPNGSSTTDSLSIGVIVPGPAVVSARTGGQVTLTAQFKAPPGASVLCEWLRYDGSSYDPVGLNGPALPLSNLTAASAGIYVRRVQLMDVAGFGLTDVMMGGSTQVLVNDSPGLENGFALPPIYIGQAVLLKVPGEGNPTKYSASGLPPGIGLQSNGWLIGKAKTAKTYNVTFTLTNPTGVTKEPTVPWTVLALPEGVAGNFSGLVERGALNGGHGGMISVDVTADGSYSGYVTLAGQRTSLSGVLEVPAGGVNPVARIKLKAYAPFSELTISNATRTLTGTLLDGASPGAAVSAVHSAWTNASQAADYKGSYNAGLFPPASVLPPATAYPQGTGYARLSVSPVGVATWSGKLADNSSFTLATKVGSTGAVPLHAMLNSNTGSDWGWIQIATMALVDGTVTWWQDTHPTKSTNRNYKSGFPLHELTLSGARYVAPVGVPVLGLPATTSNAELDFSLGGLASPLAQLLQITAANKAVLPTGVALNPAKVTVTNLKASTGLFDGSFQRVDPDPLDPAPVPRNLTRTAKFYGLLVTRPGINAGVGYFNLPELPDAPGEKVTNTPQHSGKVELGAP